MAKAKHRWRRKRDQLNSFIAKVERQRKHEEMLEEHRRIKKSGLRPTASPETES